MSSFEFLSVLISVVIGLGIANLLTGIGRLLHGRMQFRLSSIHLAWTLFVFLYMVIYWWTVVFGWQSWENWNILLFLFVLAYGVLLYLLSVILYPPEITEDWDIDSHFFAMRRWFFGFFAAMIVLEIVDSYLKAHLDQFAAPYWVLMTSWLALAVVGWISSSRRIHRLLVTYVILSLLTWVGFQLRDLDWPRAG